MTRQHRPCALTRGSLPAEGSISIQSNMAAGQAFTFTSLNIANTIFITIMLPERRRWTTARADEHFTVWLLGG